MSAATRAPTAEPLRVLYVVSLFPCWSETFIAREIATLVAAGVDVRILSLKPPSEKLVQPEAVPLLERVQHPARGLGAVAAQLGGWLRHPLAFGAAALRILWRLRGEPLAAAKSLVALGRGIARLRWIERFDPHVLHAHWATYPSTVAMALAQALDKPFGFTAHAHDIFVDDHLLHEKLSTASIPVTISRYGVDWLSERVTPLARERLHVVHCGVDLPAFAYRREGRAGDLIAAVGRLDPIKGFDVLIEALALLAADGVRFRCRIVGEGPQQAELEAAIARHGLHDRVELLGARPQADVRALLHEAACFVLPSVVTADGNRDGIPVALMEAMAVGTPVVSTFVSGIPELVADGHDGLLVAERDPAALAAALRRILADAELRDSVARAARQRIEREFDARIEAGKLLDLFRQVAHAR
ncbi:glycosyltransferase [Dokdonella sp.]|uniref:glycosyltransferase n=1 Tax=Dokdonella sp. TaxID=2291710 RepID=UPI001AFFD608|nr:glycosyltransferase [Dokdonella sp.]MBO9661988.1 glycosyltransferase [Dokdonella sp.]